MTPTLLKLQEGQRIYVGLRLESSTPKCIKLACACRGEARLCLPRLDRQDSVLWIVDGEVVSQLPKRGEPSEPRRHGEQPEPARWNAVRVREGVVYYVDRRDHNHHEEGGVQRDVPLKDRGTNSIYNRCQGVSEQPRDETYQWK